MDSLMIFWFFLIGIIVGVAIGLTLVHKVAIYPLHKKIEKLEANDTDKEKRNEIIKKINNNKYPFSIENFRFIDEPIDGIQFEENQILFVKLKNTSKLNPLQKNVKKLIQQGKINWFELKIS
jgi:predicted Holliday junction resolvase-like endonuclease